MIAGHVVVVGAGGIGCPAAWGLVHAGIERLTLLDGDTVERSNLPRQVLFDAKDVGAPKASAAARALADRATQVTAHDVRLDETNVRELWADADVVIDATDGALTKDWINQAAVHLGRPLVHAAGLRSEARLLPVPAGGRPCLACLFGRLREDAGSCADLGVWNGVVGTIGFLAAEVAVAMLSGVAPAAAYGVLDFEAGRALSLEAGIDAQCPICAAPAAGLASLPGGKSCDVPAPTVMGETSRSVTRALDLRDVRCPLNLLHAREALDAASAGDVLRFTLGEEGAATVPDGVRILGHRIVRDEPQGRGRLLEVRVAKAAPSDDFHGMDVERFARQLVLPDLGPAGQAKLQQATVDVAGTRGGAGGGRSLPAMRRHRNGSGDETSCAADRRGRRRHLARCVHARGDSRGNRRLAGTTGPCRRDAVGRPRAALRGLPRCHEPIASDGCAPDGPRGGFDVAGCRACEPTAGDLTDRLSTRTRTSSMGQARAPSGAPPRRTVGRVPIAAPK